MGTSVYRGKMIMWMPSRVMDECAFIKVLEVFVDNVNEEVSGPDLKDMLRMSSKTIYGHLHDFERKGYIIQKRTGPRNTRYYTLNLDNELMKELVLAENMRIVHQLEQDIKRCEAEGTRDLAQGSELCCDFKDAPGYPPAPAESFWITR